MEILVHIWEIFGFVSFILLEICVPVVFFLFIMWLQAYY